jgi:hypothetical protein
MVGKIRAEGRDARPADVVAMLIVNAPTTAPALTALLTRHHRLIGGTVAGLPGGRRRRIPTGTDEQLMMWLPAPVTLRLNRLIAIVHDSDFRTSRRQLVSALIIDKAATGRAKLTKAFDDYLTTPAHQAAVPGEAQSTVLRQARPKPGRRPM